MNADGTDTLHIDDNDLIVRPIAITDAERLARLFDRLSPSSVHFRFFSPISRPPRAALLRLADVDHGRREALVALDGDEIVAVARYDGRPDGNRAEIAITVEDAWQHRGVGGALVDRLAARARAAGVQRLIATTLAVDGRARRMLTRVADPIAERDHDGLIETTARLRTPG